MSNLQEVVEKIKENAKKSGQVVGKVAEDTFKKAGDVVEITKRKIKITELEASIDALYKNIGREIYKNHEDADEVFDESAVNAFIATIDEKKELIDQLVGEVSELSGKSHCSKCGFSVKAGMNFCPSCGEEQF